MTRRYLWLFVAALAAAGIAGMAARGTRTPVPESAPETAAALPVSVEIQAHEVVASTPSIPAGSRVVLTVTNSSAAPAWMRLAGYEDRVDTGPIAPGRTVRITFVADRPGERFAWIVGEEPRGRLDVTGSHLVEGHR